MQKIGIVLGLILVLTLVAGPSAAVELGVRGYYWFPGLSGDVRVDENGESGTEVDFVDDIGLEEESYPMIELFFGLGNHTLSFMYYMADYSGTTTLEKDVNFGDKTFAESDEVNSTLQYTVMDFLYQWNIINLENVLAGTSLGIVGKVKYFDITTSLESGGDKGETDFGVPIPMVGANLHVGLLADILEARLQITGIGYAGSSIIDFMGDISLSPLPFVDIHAGYRSFIMNIDAEDVEANFATTGPYAALTISF